MVYDPFLDEPREPGGCLGLAAMVLWSWVAVITVAVVYVARGWPAAAALTAVYVAAIVATFTRYVGWEVDELDRPVARDRHPAGAGVAAAERDGFRVVQLLPLDVLFNLADPDCELCQAHPGRASDHSYEPCVCTTGEPGRWA